VTFADMDGSALSSALQPDGAQSPRRMEFVDASAWASHEEIWKLLYAECHLLWLAQVILSLNAILCFMRVLNWLTVWQGLGTLSVILMALVDDVVVFLIIFFLVLIGFAAAFIGLMPTLGTGEFDASGPFQAPFWAMFGEFGELPELCCTARSGARWCSGCTRSLHRCCSSTC